MIQYKQAFDSYIWVKSKPNEHEIALLEKWQKYISKLSKIPGIEMIAIVNSLSMYATHTDSDIDLFIITKPWMIWFVRFFATLILWWHGVWRKGTDIAGNFCLSFFITTDVMDLSHIAIQDDIYLYYWIYYMHPIYEQNNTYKKFLDANSWVVVDMPQIQENKKWKLTLPDSEPSIKAQERQKWWKENKSTKENIYNRLNTFIRYILLPRTQRTHERLWRPEGIIITDNILKFHDRDRRKIIRDSIISRDQ